CLIEKLQGPTESPVPPGDKARRSDNRTPNFDGEIRILFAIPGDALRDMPVEFKIRIEALDRPKASGEFRSDPVVLWGVHFVADFPLSLPEAPRLRDVVEEGLNITVVGLPG